MATTMNLTIPYVEHAHDALTAEDRRLVEAAKAACDTSYAPYSGFHVGAAILLENGEIVCGSNQENVAFTPGTCAERCAMHYANARFPNVAPLTIAIAARGKDGFTGEPIAPCGVCRQVLLESEMRAGQPLRILLHGTRCVTEIPSAATLLPFQFDSF